MNKEQNEPSLIILRMKDTPAGFLGRSIMGEVLFADDKSLVLGRSVLVYEGLDEKGLTRLNITPNSIYTEGEIEFSIEDGKREFEFMRKVLKGEDLWNTYWPTLKTFDKILEEARAKHAGLHIPPQRKAFSQDRRNNADA